MLSNIALVLNALGLIGVQLVWFEGDQTRAQLPFFCLVVATFLFNASVTLSGDSRNASGLLRAAGTFFLLQNIELALCSLPPTALYMHEKVERRDTTYAGGTLVLIVVFASFVASYTGAKAPALIGKSGKTFVDRLVSIRGIAFLIASCFLIIASAIQWAWSTQCNAPGRDAIKAWYPVTNATLFITAFIFLFAVVYGDNETQNISIFLAATLLFSGSADPLFDSKVEWNAQESASNSNLRFFKRWQAAKGLSFIAAVLVLLSALVTSARTQMAAKTVVIADVVTFGIAIAGAVCVWSRNPTSNEPIAPPPQYPKAWRDYSVAYAVVITALNLFQGLTGAESAPLISTFLGVAVLQAFDQGSWQTESGYVRGGLQLCALSVVLSTLLKAFPVDKPLLSYIKIENKCATGFAIVWTLLSMLFVPTRYSAVLIFALISYKAVSSGCANWGQTTFYILAWYGVVKTFPLTSDLSFNVNDYRLSTIWAASAFFAVCYAATGSGSAPALDNPQNNSDSDVAAAPAAEEMQPNAPNDEPVA